MSTNQLYAHGARGSAYNRRDRDNQCGRNDGWQSRTRRATDQLKPPPLQGRTHRSGDGDTSGLLLRSLVNSTVIHEFSTVLLSQVFCDSGGQRRLSVINVLFISSCSNTLQMTYTNGTDARLSAYCSYVKRKGVLEMRLLPAEFTSSFRRVAPGR